MKRTHFEQCAIAMKFGLILCGLSFATYVKAADPTSVGEMELVFQKTLTGDAYDELTGLARDSHGNISVAGTFRNSLDFDPGPDNDIKTAEGSDEFGFFGKYNPEGDLEWVHVYKSYLRGNTKHGGLAVDKDDNVIVTGICKGTVDLGFGLSGGVIPSASGWAAFIAKYGTNGEFKWAVPILPSSGTGYPKPEKVKVLPNGDVILTGVVSGKIDFDPSESESIVESRDGYSMGFVAKYNADGIFQWIRTISNAGKILASPSPENGLSVAGTFFDSTSIAGGDVIYSDSRFESSNSLGLFSAALDSEGGLLWSKEFGVSATNVSDEDIGAVAVADNGVTYVAGRYHGEFRIDDRVLADTLRYQLFWVALDDQGGLINAFSHAFDCLPRSMAVKGSDLIISGDVHGDTLGGIENASFFVSRYSASDTVVWLGNAGGKTSDNLDEFVMLSGDTVLLGGYHYNSDIPDRDPFFGKWTLPEVSSALYKTDLGKGFSPERLRFTPWMLTITGGETKSELVIMDANGSRVLVSPVPASEVTQVPLVSLSPGMYLARVVGLKRKSPVLKIHVGF